MKATTCIDYIYIYIYNGVQRIIYNAIYNKKSIQYD